MTMHTRINPSDRTLLPRGLIARRGSNVLPPLESASQPRRRRVYRANPWRFSVGQMVLLGMLPGIVQGRGRTALGREVYTVRPLGENYGREFRDILGTALALEPSSDPSHSKPHKIREKQDGRCCYCLYVMVLSDKQPPNAETLEHLRQRSEGGRNNRDNIALACKRSNEERGGMDWLLYTTYRRGELWELIEEAASTAPRG